MWPIFERMFAISNQRDRTQNLMRAHGFSEEEIKIGMRIFAMKFVEPKVPEIMKWLFIWFACSVSIYYVMEGFKLLPLLIVLCWIMTLIFLQLNLMFLRWSSRRTELMLAKLTQEHPQIAHFVLYNQNV